VGNALKKVQSGERFRIPPAAYNAFVDAALDYQQRKQNSGARTGGSVPRGTIYVRNQSGAAVGRFAVLGIDSPSILPSVSEEGFQNHLILDGVAPVVGTHEGRFVITAEPIAAGEMGQGYASGVCQVQVDVGDEDHQFADITDADPTKLTSGTSGAAQILWKEAGTGTVWAIVRLAYSAGSGTIRRARAQEDAPGDAFLSVKLLDAAGNETGDAFDATEINGRIFTSLNPNVVTGDDLLVTEVDGTWYVLNFTPSQAAAGNVVRVTITGSGDDGHSYIAAQLDDATPITLYNVNGNLWYNLLPNLKNTSNRNKCFALNVGGTWYAIPDFSNIGRVT